MNDDNAAKIGCAYILIKFLAEIVLIGFICWAIWTYVSK